MTDLPIVCRGLVNSQDLKEGFALPCARPSATI